MVPSDTDKFTFVWTRRQLYEVRQALKKRMQFMKQGFRRGFVEEQDVLLIDALLSDIKEKLDEDRNS
jgi:hypothetical protein